MLLPVSNFLNLITPETSFCFLFVKPKTEMPFFLLTFSLINFMVVFIKINGNINHTCFWLWFPERKKNANGVEIVHTFLSSSSFLPNPQENPMASQFRSLKLLTPISETPDGFRTSHQNQAKEGQRGWKSLLRTIVNKASSCYCQPSTAIAFKKL